MSPDPFPIDPARWKMMTAFEPLDPSLLASACGLLRRLGVSENYKGFRYAACAAALCALSQDRLLLVTKLLYPDIAKRFDTSWSCVEHDLRTVVNVAWNHNPSLLSDLAQCALAVKPPCAQFIAALAHGIRSDSVDPFLPPQFDPLL